MVGLRSVFWDSREIPFERVDTAILAKLLRHIGEALPAPFFGKSDKRVAVAVYRIRHLFKCEKMPFDIETIHTVGYKLVKLDHPNGFGRRRS